MYDFYIYFLQVNAALLVFYVLYRMLFCQDTFLGIRRLFLFTVVFLAFTSPMVSLATWLGQKPSLPAVMISYAELLTVAAAAVPVEKESIFTWQNMIMLIWGGGTLLLLVRMLTQLVCLCHLASGGRRMMWNETRVIVLEKTTAPFSFFGWIFINPADHDEKELQEIMAHEKAHVRQWHSVDMILGELLCIFFWFNPAVWLLRYEIRQNLEFLADQKVVCAGYNRKNYQYHLLRLSHQSTAVQIVNNFNVSQLKKRIIMMNKKKTSRIGLVKYALLLPVTGLLILAGNAQAVAGIATETIMTQKTGDVIKGRVVDEAKKPLKGVTVLVKDANIGTSTDQDGKFVLEGYNTADLVFSYVGKKSQVITFNKDNKSPEVVMQTESMQLDRIVVVGYALEEPKTTEKDETFVVVEEMPVFVEGQLSSFLSRNIKYPTVALENKVQGKVFVSFVIDKTGKVTQPKIVKSVEKSLDQEALRVIGLLPDWRPGKQRGMPVDVLYTLPIEFKVDQKGEQTYQVMTLPAEKMDAQENVTISRISSANDHNEVQSVSIRRSAAVDSSTVAAALMLKKNILYIVDGEKMSKNFNIKTIDPNTIQDISVLKDQSAILIYGEKGKNGVIIINTKGGSKESR